MKRFLIKLDTGYVGATHEDEVEFEDHVWDSMTEEQRTNVLEAECRTLAENHIETYWEEL